VIQDVHPLDTAPIARGGFSDVWMCQRVNDGKRHKFGMLHFWPVLLIIAFSVGVKVIQCNDNAFVERYAKMVKVLDLSVRVVCAFYTFTAPVPRIVNMATPTSPTCSSIFPEFAMPLVHLQALCLRGWLTVMLGNS